MLSFTLFFYNMPHVTETYALLEPILYSSLSDNTHFNVKYFHGMKKFA